MPSGGTQQALGTGAPGRPSPQWKVCRCTSGSDRVHAQREKGVGGAGKMPPLMGRAG